MADAGGARATVVETIPLGIADLPAAAESTGDALVRLVDGASRSIDLTALYWSLRPSLDDEDTEGWTIVELLALGADRGQALYDSLAAAAARGVRLRIVESPGFDEAGAISESALLRDAHPANVEVRTIALDQWFGTGIMHQKVWVFDGRSVYVGSANNDWRSLAQVKELGLVVEDEPDVAADATAYFDGWWRFAALEPDERTTAVVFDPASRVRRRVPAWSPTVPEANRRPNPLVEPDQPRLGGWGIARRAELNGEVGEVLLSGAPRELCVEGQTFDGDLLTATILEAESRVCVNVMDFAPVSIYRPTDIGVDDDALPSPVWWPDLFSALLQAVATNRVTARLLVSEWAHTSPFVTPFLEALVAAARAAAANPRMAAGALEARRFRVPGWQETGPRTDERSPRFPGHTRVNHVKYVVTDKRANIGTSNMTWDYFNATAGASVNVSHPSVVADLQRLFDRDWLSPYATPLV